MSSSEEMETRETETDVPASAMPAATARPDTASPRGLLLVDAAGTILFCNSQAGSWLGVARAQLVQTAIHHLASRFLQEDGHPFPDAVHPLLTFGQQERMSPPTPVLLIRPDGAHLSLLLQVDVHTSVNSTVDAIMLTLVVSAEEPPEPLPPVELIPTPPIPQPVVPDPASRAIDTDWHAEALEQAPVVVFIIQEGRFRYLNPYFLHYTGYTYDEAQALPSLAFIAPEYREMLQARTRALQDGEPPITLTAVKVITKDGRECWLDATLRRITYAGQPALLLTAVDATLRVRQATAIPASAEPLPGVATSLPYTLFTQDRDLRYTWVSTPGLPIPSATLIGSTDAEVMPEEEACRIMTLKRRVLETGQALHREMRLVIARQEYWFTATFIPLYDAYGEVTGLLGCVQDISARKTANAQE